MSQLKEPQLAAPGAGIPRVERVIGGFFFSIRGRWGSVDSFTRKFESERERIRWLVESCDSKEAGKQVLIARIRGLEDSSRYWSMAMTLEHLRITNTTFAGVIRTLIAGKVPEGKASTAAVKPRGGVGVEVLMDYEQSCDELLNSILTTNDLRTVTKFSHPWFGPMNAREWYALAGSHMGIHRIQMERIIKGLTANFS